MTQDLAHKRPWLLASLLCGLTYPISQGLNLPEFAAIFWKMAGVALLVPYALRRHHNGDFAILAGFLTLCALGDGLIELDPLWGGMAFAVAHAVAITLYLRHWRKRPAFSQKLLAMCLLIFAPVIAYSLPANRSDAVMVAVYAVFVSAMAATAWSSQFPRYRVGMGAVLFLISDLLIFARIGPLAGWKPVSLLIWYLYYGGVVLIATGVVTTLVKRGHYPEG
jgi:uncharacterized membrane protein YhhN